MSDRTDVVLLTGPAAAGKTEAARMWATTRPYPTAQVSLDDVRYLVRSGFANPEDGWTPEAGEQLDLARSIVADMARRYAAGGIRLIVDDAIFPDRDAAGEEPWHRALAGISYALLVLLPGFDVVRRRNLLRNGQRRLREETLRTIYDDMLGWRDKGVPVIDNSDLTVAETVDLIEQSLAGQR